MGSYLSFPGGSVVKNPPAEQETQEVVSIPGLGTFSGEGHGNPLQFSCRENPMDRGAWWATVHRVARSRMQLKRLSMQARGSYLTYLGVSFFRMKLGRCSSIWQLLERPARASFSNWPCTWHGRGTQPMAPPSLTFRRARIKEITGSFLRFPQWGGRCSNKARTVCYWIIKHDTLEKADGPHISSQCSIPTEQIFLVKSF